MAMAGRTRFLKAIVFVWVCKLLATSQRRYSSKCIKKHDADHRRTALKRIETYLSSL